MLLSTDQKEVQLTFESLQPFDTVVLRTHNSDYRILLLDPKTGRALVEGGQLVAEPTEAFLCGSRLHGPTFKPDTIAIGHRLEMWIGEMIVSTSAIQSISVTAHDAAESKLIDTVAVH